MDIGQSNLKMWSGHSVISRVVLLLFGVLLSCCVHLDMANTRNTTNTHIPPGLDVPSSDLPLLRERVRVMFKHAYDGYMKHAFPLDELQPISCQGRNTLGFCSVTLIDALDSLVVLGEYDEFGRAVEWIVENVNFDIDQNVSVFETNIRVVGGLLSGHFMALMKRPSSHPDHLAHVSVMPSYDHHSLLDKAIDVADRLLPAFDTATGMPYGTVNLRNGVPPGETPVACTACVGTFLLEFTLLSRMTGNPAYENAARNAARALFARQSKLGLYGNHINVQTGQWTHTDAGIGPSIDSWYEYLIKAAILFDDAEYNEMFEKAYISAVQHLYHAPWYFDVNMDSGKLAATDFKALQAFWPSIQVLRGDLSISATTLQSFGAVWRRYGYAPEAVNLATGKTQFNRHGYPLRPELAESLVYMHGASNATQWLNIGRDMVTSLEGTRVECGHAAVDDVDTHSLRDHMDSFFLSETSKYLFLLFSPSHWAAPTTASHSFVFNTEAHLFPLDFRSFVQTPIPSQPQPPPQAQPQPHPPQSTKPLEECPDRKSVV
eukprot:TRINITY_DN1260_c0_g1_i1.p1 TRINITY_DN1260_c0_g1~~TRINITY_DN1260_c0_g1_i1.p1  ORF type:complete len:546 (+),score=99.39 TRINITY_DN1260_c0_g1_i1:129-1766(+)